MCLGRSQNINKVPCSVDTLPLPLGLSNNDILDHISQLPTRCHKETHHFYYRQISNKHYALDVKLMGFFASNVPVLLIVSAQRAKWQLFIFHFAASTKRAVVVGNKILRPICLTLIS